MKPIKERSARARRRRLMWIDTGAGVAAPDCRECFGWWMDPAFDDAILAAATDPSRRPADVARRLVERWHAEKHPPRDPSWRADT